MALYNSGARYNSGLRYNAAPPQPQTPKHKRTMAKISLELKDKTEQELIDFVETVDTKMTGNANFPTPVPSQADFKAPAALLSDKLAEIAQIEATLREARSALKALRAAVEEVLKERAGYVDDVADGDETKILGAGFKVRSTNTTPTMPSAPQGLSVTRGDDEGEMDLQWEPVPNARTYVVEMRIHATPENAWTQAELPTKSRTSLNGLTPGQRYEFRVRAVGAAGMSGWSDVVLRMAT